MPGTSSNGTAPHPDSLGVIIATPAPLAGELNRWRASYGGPAAVVVPPHITLVSGMATANWALAADHVRAVAATTAPFTIGLRGSNTFRPLSPVIYLNVVQGAEQCVELHEKLQVGPLEHAPEFEFKPHLTVAHDLDDDAMDRAEREMVDFAATFEVTSIGLFDCSQGGWTLREELALGGERS